MILTTSIHKKRGNTEGINICTIKYLVEFKWSTLKYTHLLRQLQIYESGIEEGGASILVQVDGDPVPPTYYIYTTKHGYAYLC